MSKQHHFVVVYDDESDSFYIDDDTADMNFSDGVVFDTVTEEWMHVDIDPRVQTNDDRARDRLTIGLEIDKKVKHGT